jgi:hypothetical protein
MLSLLPIRTVKSAAKVRHERDVVQVRHGGICQLSVIHTVCSGTITKEVRTGLSY